MRDLLGWVLRIESTGNVLVLMLRKLKAPVGAKCLWGRCPRHLTTRDQGGMGCAYLGKPNQFVYLLPPRRTVAVVGPGAGDNA